MEFFATFQFAGVVIGLAAGALSVRRRWDAVPGAIGALGAFMVGPVVGVVPVGAGYFSARWLASNFGRPG